MNIADIKEAAWAEGMNCAVTVCDCEGIILYMNEKSRETFAKSGKRPGDSLIDCHNERSRAIMAHMLKSGETNCYTITKGGRKKMIYQTPWRRGGEVAGLVEISMVIPADMPHYDRDAEAKAE